jgi:hypothetical protein
VLSECIAECAFRKLLDGMTASQYLLGLVEFMSGSAIGKTNVLRRCA